jgi:hypothetical protein
VLEAPDRLAKRAAGERIQGGQSGQAKQKIILLFLVFEAGS